MLGHDAIVQHVASTTIKASPPIAVILTTLAGVPWQTVVYILTAGYLVVQTAYGIYKWRREWREDRAAKPKPTVPRDR